MGTWAHTNFGNDQAFIWLKKFLVNPTAELLHVTLARIAEANEQMDDGTPFLDAAYGQEALAAAEIVAALLNKPGPDFPLEPDEEEDKWDEISQIWVDEPLRAMAQAAVKRLVRPDGYNELRELWKESGDYFRWRRGLNELVERLQELAPPPFLR
ncbi:MAG: DUF4259 domain-containing protein [Bernardetiaceae bacterium]|jgi:hypothetical protein|nr:DUF4259 domain-containing protein [Bernardetiaceae bacterium]